MDGQPILDSDDKPSSIDDSDAHPSGAGTLNHQSSASQIQHASHLPNITGRHIKYPGTDGNETCEQNTAGPGHVADSDTVEQPTTHSQTDATHVDEHSREQAPELVGKVSISPRETHLDSTHTPHSLPQLVGKHTQVLHNEVTPVSSQDIPQDSNQALHQPSTPPPYPYPPTHPTDDSDIINFNELPSNTDLQFSQPPAAPHPYDDPPDQPGSTHTVPPTPDADVQSPQTPSVAHPHHTMPPKPPKTYASHNPHKVAKQVISGLNMLSPLSEPNSPDASGSRSPEADTSWQQLMNGTNFTTRFSVEDITKNLSLVKAARKELDGTVPPAVAPDELAEMLEVWQHDGDLERQREVLTGIDHDAQEESSINRELASVMVQRIKNSTKGVEALSKMLTEWSRVEQAATAALTNIADNKYMGINDAQSMRHAVGALQDLVAARAGAAAIAHQSLVAQQKLLAQLQVDLKAASKQINLDAAAIQKKVDTARSDLLAAFEQHSQVCLAFDSGFRFNPSSSTTSRAVRRALEHDPWITEEQLVQRHTELQRQQDSQRHFLKRALGQVQQLETQRVSVLNTVLAGIAEQGSALLPLSNSLQNLEAAVHSAEANPELLELAQIAGSATQSAEELAARQAESIAGVCQELFASPEIMRQGSMMYWHPITGQWKDCHFVMTRAGFLHWFTNLTDTRQRDALNLSRCELINGEAQVFNMVEKAAPGMFGFVQSSSRKCTFKAHSVDEYCEWAIAIREAIVAVSGKHVQYLRGN